MKKLQRSSIAPTLPAAAVSGDADTSGPELSQQLVKSIVQQAHLCPLPLTSTPIFWELDHAFRLTPLPHLVCQQCSCSSCSSCSIIVAVLAVVVDVV